MYSDLTPVYLAMIIPPKRVSIATGALRMAYSPCFEGASRPFCRVSGREAGEKKNPPPAGDDDTRITRLAEGTNQ